jgi:hypothetical protein
MHKGFKYLDPSIDRIYVSRDVIFDEIIFPLTSLNPNASAHYHSNVLLIPSTSSRDNGFTNTTDVSTLSSLPIFGDFVQVHQ